MNHRGVGKKVHMCMCMIVLYAYSSTWIPSGGTSSSPLSAITTFFSGLSPGRVFTFSILVTMSMPSNTSPNTTCLPSSHLRQGKLAWCSRWLAYRSLFQDDKSIREGIAHDVTMVVMKNWEPLVSFPALAMDNRPGFVCFSLKFSSSKRSP